MSQTEFAVTGMTCGHCVTSVTEELTAIEGVHGVHIDLVAGGASTVRVESDRPISETAIAAAIDEAGYALEQAAPELSAPEQSNLIPLTDANTTADAGAGSCCGGGCCSTAEAQ